MRIFLIFCLCFNIHYNFLLVLLFHDEQYLFCDCKIEKNWVIMFVIMHQKNSGLLHKMESEKVSDRMTKRLY